MLNLHNSYWSPCKVFFFWLLFLCVGRGLAFLFSGSIWHFRKLVSYPRAHRYCMVVKLDCEPAVTDFQVQGLSYMLYSPVLEPFLPSPWKQCQFLLCELQRSTHTKSWLCIGLQKYCLLWMWIPGRNWRPQQSKLGWNTDFHSQVWFLKNWANLIMNGKRGELEVEDLLKEEVYGWPYSAHCFWSFRNSLGFSAPCDWPWATLKVHS